MQNSKKKIFILFCGELRFFYENFLSINDYLKDYKIIFLFYHWDYENKKIIKFKKYYKNCEFDYIYQKNWDNYIDKIKFPDNSNNIINLFYMWDALTQSFFKIKNKLSDDDLILRFRTDIKINSKHLPLNLKKINVNTLYIPDCYHWNGYNDQVFITKAKTLKKFQSFFKFLKDEISNNRFICPEYIFYNFVKKKSIRIIFFELDYQLLRYKKKIESIIKKKTYIPIKDRIIIKFLKISYKLRNFKSFFIDKKKRNKTQNFFYE